MNRLVRTRSQHFVSSPRKVASPLKHKHALAQHRHPAKKRKIGAIALDLEIDGSEDEHAPGPSRRTIGTSSKGRPGNGRKPEPLNSDLGSQRVNRGRDRDVFDDNSPRKRKRGSGEVRRGREKGEEGMEEEEDEGGGSGSRGSGPSEVGSGSWVEVDDEDEDEPEFIAESGSADMMLAGYRPTWTC